VPDAAAGVGLYVQREVVVEHLEKRGHGKVLVRRSVRAQRHVVARRQLEAIKPEIAHNPVMAWKDAGNRGRAVGIGDGRQPGDRRLDLDPAMNETAFNVGQVPGLNQLVKPAAIKPVHQEKQNRALRQDEIRLEVQG
jgi:hypothetical protein